MNLKQGSGEKEETHVVTVTDSPRERAGERRFLLMSAAGRAREPSAASGSESAQCDTIWRQTHSAHSTDNSEYTKNNGWVGYVDGHAVRSVESTLVGPGSATHHTDVHVAEVVDSGVGLVGLRYSNRLAFVLQ